MNLSILEHGPFAGLMEKMMSKSNETFGDHDTTENTELDAATGGWNAVEQGAITGAATGCTKANGSGSWLGALATAMGQAMAARL
jgi:hypothetical protein